MQNYIYWLISTENDHRHHHKFIKYEKRLRKEGNMLGLPINNNQAKSLPLQREIWRVALPWVLLLLLLLWLRKTINVLMFTFRRMPGKMFAPSNGNGQTDPLHISCIYSIWKILHFYSSLSLNPSKSAFFHALTVSLLPKNHMLFIVSKQCACSRRVQIEGHMNRFKYCHPDNNSDNDSFGYFLSKNRIFCSITRC